MQKCKIFSFTAPRRGHLDNVNKKPRLPETKKILPTYHLKTAVNKQLLLWPETKRGPRKHVGEERNRRKAGGNTGTRALRRSHGLPGKRVGIPVHTAAYIVLNSIDKTLF